MIKFFVNIVCFLIPFKNVRKRVRNKLCNYFSIKVSGEKNALRLGYKDCFIAPSTMISNKNLKLGKYVWIGGFCSFFCDTLGIEIGDNVAIADYNVFMTTNHNYDNDTYLPFDNNGVSAPIVIGNNVWIGTRCIILPGVKIDDGAIIGAGSVVTKSVPKCAIVAGNPAKIVGWRDKKVYEELVKNKCFYFRDVKTFKEGKIIRINFKSYMSEKK